MRTNRNTRYKINYGRVILVVLVISVIFGFLFDFVCTRIELSVYPKPSEYKSFVSEYSEKYRVPENLVYAVIKVESKFDSSAESSVGALGLMQMMPDTFSWLTNDRLGDRFSVGMLYDPETNIKYGVYYLSWLYDRYADWDITLAAYNAGPENVDKWLEDPTVSDLETGKLINIPFKETREYVKKVNKALGKYESLYDKK
jgi:soluble lytic murein transglycosylase